VFLKKEGVKFFHDFLTKKQVREKKTFLSLQKKAGVKRKQVPLNQLFNKKAGARKVNFSVLT
jgi:hypothetical protein